MLKFVSKFFLEILPSVVATVVGAYIVNYYIIPKVGPGAPNAAAYSRVAPANDQDQSTIDITPKRQVVPAQNAKSAASDKGKAGDKAVAAKGIDKASEKPVETLKAASEVKRLHSREKVIARSAPLTPGEIAPTTDEPRDANELARAAIERLHTSTESAHQSEILGQAQKLPHEPERMNVVDTPSSTQLGLVMPPPSVNVVAPSGDGGVGITPAQTLPLDKSTVPRGVTNRPIPPADIPPASSSRVDLQTNPASVQTTSVADDMLSAARSVIQAVVPQ